MRQYVRLRLRWAALGVLAVAVIVLAAVAGAALVGVIAVLVAAGWVWLMPTEARRRARGWPAVALGVLCIGAVMVLPARSDAGLFGSTWHLASPVGDLPIDQVVLMVGAVAFLLESANIVVRAALDAEMTPPLPMDADPSAQPGAVPAPETVPVLKGGRLIGPLERIVVFALTLAGIYALLAAVLAAKGIVRFPEISRDGDSGNRAEYFLIGSLVSWVIALGAAFLVWWGFARG